jgi:hypothetical protein
MKLNDRLKKIEQGLAKRGRIKPRVNIVYCSDFCGPDPRDPNFGMPPTICTRLYQECHCDCCEEKGPWAMPEEADHPT